MSKSVRVVCGLLLLGAALTTGVASAAERPKEATGICKDGSFYTGSDQVNACKNNGGLQEWWGKVVAPKDVPNKDAVTSDATSKDARGPHDKALQPNDPVPPAKDKR